MGYIMDLRAYVGYRPLIQVGAGILVEDGQGRVLLQLRSDSRLWCFSAAGSPPGCPVGSGGGSRIGRGTSSP